MNDGVAQNRMKSDVGSFCADYYALTPTEQAEITQAYIRGYRFGLKNTPASININIDN